MTDASEFELRITIFHKNRLRLMVDYVYNKTNMKLKQLAYIFK